MIKGYDFSCKAISILVLGVAFFLVSCQPKTIRERPPEAKALQDHFASAEQYTREGSYYKAIESYALFLKQHPMGEKSLQALFRIGRLYSIQDSHEKALSHFLRMIREYPDQPDTPIVRYEVAVTYYHLKDYLKSNLEASEWLKRYPNHPLKGEILFLIGNNFRELGDKPKAFSWWIQSSEKFDDSSNRREEIVGRIMGLLEESRIGELEEMKKYATESNYLPHIYHRLASIYLEENRLPEARDAAIFLVQSTSEKRWINIGEEIINKILKNLSARERAIGCLLPLSGSFAIYGQEVLNGIQLGMGIFNRPEERQKVELVIKDTGGSVEDAISGVEELAQEENVMVIIGPLLSKEALAAAKKAQELSVPIITLTQKDGITAEGEMVYRNFLTPPKEIGRILDKSLNDLGLKKFAILYPDNAYGRVFMNLFWDGVETMGGEITAVESYKPDQTDFAAEIKKMVGLFYPRPDSVRQMLGEMKSLAAEEKIEEKAKPNEEPEPIVDFDAVFIPDNPQRIALIAPQFPFYDIYDIQLLGTSLWQSTDLIKMAGDYVQKAIFPSGFFKDSESNYVKEFIELFRESFESDPGILAATGYDTMEMVKHLLKNSLIISRKDFQKALSGLKDFYGVTGRIAFDDQGEVEKEPLLLTISGKHIAILP
ncbi:MAG: penicillin-binding protein activator [Pseudomonadota bacterium]